MKKLVLSILNLERTNVKNKQDWTFIVDIHKKNSFAEIAKNLARYKS